MNTKFHSLLIVVALSASSTLASAHPTYTGYSGAPGSNGRCASTCHGSPGGTIQISGFPTQYQANQAYTITISHNGGNMVRQFNGSCRVGAGSANAGVITAGSNTATYNTPVETNGIRSTLTSLHTGTFTWTAPPAGTGEVRLYVAGLQGTYDGLDTTLMLAATEQTTGAGEGSLPVDVGHGLVSSACPNPFTSRTTIGFTLANPSMVFLEIFDSAGRKVESYAAEQSSGHHDFTWSPLTRPAGVYYFRIQAGNRTETRKLLLID